jgi:hypothetical protein
VPGTIAQQKAQLTEALDLSRSRLEANLSRQRISTVVNSIPLFLGLLLGAGIVSAFLLTIRRHFQ